MAPPAKQSSQRRARKKKASFFKRHHAMLMVVVVCGWLVPPLAVFIRFGIGIDFFLNIIFTCLGYIPGHVHNYYLQYIRNNYGRGRTPKWALRAGLVEDNTAYVKSTRQWGNRYGERNPNNVYDDDTQPYTDEFGNTVEPQGWVEEHGIRPAQPGAGFGGDGNELHPQQEDLLAGLPEEERERRRRAKRDHKREYGAGLDDFDREEEERRRRATGHGNAENGSARGNALIDDLPEDPDVAMYRREQQPESSRKKGGRFSSFGSNNKVDEDPSSRWKGSSSKKSGRAKKSERYGIRQDHADLAGSYGGSSTKNTNSRSNKGRSTPQDDYEPRPSNDNYDVVDDQPGRRRRGDDEDFMNHQF